MARFRIVCTNQEPVCLPNNRAHIVAVGTGDDPDKADQKWTLDQVLAAMDRGDTFYTKGKHSERVAAVEKFNCHLCRRTYIRSTPDAVQDNNLDNLRRCNWN